MDLFPWFLVLGSRSTKVLIIFCLIHLLLVQGAVAIEVDNHRVIC